MNLSYELLLKELDSDKLPKKLFQLFLCENFIKTSGVDLRTQLSSVGSQH